MTGIPNNDVFFNDSLWEEFVEENGLRGTRLLIDELLRDLRKQRTLRDPGMGQDNPQQREFMKWLRKQKMFEYEVKKRRRALMERIDADPTEIEILRKERSRLMRIICALSLAIDDTDIDGILEDHTITMQDQEMTLADAIDEGFFQDRTKENA